MFTALCKTFTCHLLNHGSSGKLGALKILLIQKWEMPIISIIQFTAEKKKGKWGLNVWTPQRFGDAKYFDLGIPTNVCEGGLVATCCAKCADTTVSLVSWSLVGCRSELSKKFSRSTSELWTGGKQRPSPTQPLKRVTSKWIGRYHLLAFGASHFQHAAFYPQFW